MLPLPVPAKGEFLVSPFLSIRSQVKLYLLLPRSDLSSSTQSGRPGLTSDPGFLAGANDRVERRAELARQGCEVPLELVLFLLKVDFPL